MANLKMSAGSFTHYVNSDVLVNDNAPPAVDNDRLADTNSLEDVLRNSDPKKIKIFLRQNHWPPQHSIRKVLWWKVCSLTNKVGASVYYDDMVKDLFGSDGNDDTNLPNFVDTSSIYPHYLTPDGAKVVNKVLYVLGKSHPEVIYAPTLYTISCILLHYADEHNVFNIVEFLLNSKAKHIMQTKISHEAFTFVLKELLKKYNKKLYSYMIQQQIKPEDVTCDGIWWIFRDLPFSHVVRVIDCYLYEGHKVLYRVILAILQIFYEQKLKTTEATSKNGLSECISTFCKEMPNISVSYLLKVAFKIRGFSRKEIKKLTVKQEMYAQSLINTRGLQATVSSDDEKGNTKISLSKSFSLQEIGSEDLKEPVVKCCSQGTVYLPFAKTGSHILNLSHWNTIWCWIPDRVCVMVPELLFSTAEHGTSLRTFYSRVCDRPQCPATLLVIKTTTNKVLGAYCSSDWSERKQNQEHMAYFGTGETFLYTLEPEKKKYQWVGIDLCGDTPSSAQYFMAGDYKHIIIGGGGAGMGLRIDEDLNLGESYRCDTFNNPSLTGDIYFNCAEVEVFGFS